MMGGMKTPNLIWFGGTVRAINEDLAVSADYLAYAIEVGLFTATHSGEPYETPDGRV